MGLFSGVKSLVQGIFKDKPPPFDDRKGSASGTKADAKGVQSRTLRVREVVRETQDAISMVLVDPSGAPIAFEAGQFFTVTRHVGDKPVRRAYSASSPAHVTSEVRLTVKEVPNGLVSTDLVRNLKAGDSIDVSGPSGSFTVPGGRKRIVLIGGGSGITPLMSIARTHLTANQAMQIDLVYGSRGEPDIIFKDALKELEAEHEGRFRVRHVLEDAHEIASRQGRLDRATVLGELDGLGAFEHDGTMFFVCGPVGMMDEARAALESRKIPASRLKEERFVSPADASAGGSEEPQSVDVLLNGERHQVVVKPGLTILEAAQDQGVDMPFSCTVGGCASCRVKLKSGKVSLGEPNCLDPDEKADGYILACVSKPLGPCVVEVE
ncbi:MAG: ferredoxin--NADP reductase [Polyangiaceae bacterium]|nr:ferredoxin--NADP reductase [Polyangiaceae bacterium]